MGTCPACGEPLTGDSAYCSTCGTRLPEGAGAPPAPTFPSPSAPPPPPPPAAAAAWVPTPEGEGPRLEQTSRSVAPLVIGAVVVVALLVVGFVVLGGSDDGTSGSAGDDDTTSSTLVPLSTTPVLTDEQFVIDVIAADQGTSPLALAEENRCFFQSLVAAMGGAGALRDAGISPEQLSETFGLRGEQIPAGAVDTFLATAATCGLDLSNVLFLRPLSFELGEAVAACVAANLDTAVLNRDIAAFFLDPNRSDTTFVPSPQLTQQLDDLSAACL